MKLTAALIQDLQNIFRNGAGSRPKRLTLCASHSPPQIFDLPREISLFNSDLLVNLVTAAGLHINRRVAGATWVGIVKLHLGECDGAVLDAAARHESSDPIRRSRFIISCSTYWREPAFPSAGVLASNLRHRLTGLPFPHSLTLGTALHGDSAAGPDLACGSCRPSRS